MKKVVYKYPLDPNYPKLSIPGHGELLSAVEQKGDIVLYALVNVREKHDTYIIPDRVYDILLLGTGHEIPAWKFEGHTFLNTVNIGNGDLMFHVFYKEVI